MDKRMFTKMVQQLRDKLHVTQAQFCEKLVCNDRTLRRWMTGERNITTEVEERLRKLWDREFPK